MREKVPLPYYPHPLPAAPMELGGEVFTMGLALKLQKVPPGSTVDFSDFRRENSNTAAFVSDWDSYQVSSPGCAWGAQAGAKAKNRCISPRGGFRAA